jgi:hypothetical protein
MLLAPVNILKSNQDTKIKVKITVIFTALVLLLLKFLYPEYNLLSWDVFGYYLYLPAKFIYHDPYLLNQDWLNQIVAEYKSTASLYQISQHPETGNWIIKYSMGMSFLYAPFFFIAHWIAPILGYKQDGFSAIYGGLIETGMFLFSIVGLHYLLKILYSFFESKIAIISFLLIVFATNYMQLTVQYSLLTHIPLFTFYTILIYHTILWHKNKQAISLFTVAISSGMITLIRPNEIVCVLIPLLWDINNLKEKIKWLLASFGKFSLSLILFSIPILIQMWYWKKGTNQWLYYSYQNPGEGFDFLSPYVKEFLFSFRKGWFLYTPLAFISCLSLIQVYKNNKSTFWALLITSIISVYIVSSWSCWWYAGGSYSQRAIVSIYPLLAISLGYGVSFLYSRLKLVGIIPLVLILLLNVFQAWQFKYDILDRERMTFNYYKKIFLKTKKPDDAEKYLLVNRSAGIEEFLPKEIKYVEKNIAFHNFKSAPAGKEYARCDTLGLDDTYSLWMSETNEYVDGATLKYRQVTDKDHFWIKASVDIFIPTNYESESPLFVAHFNHGENGTYKYRSKSIPKNNLKLNQWNHLEYLYLSPEVRSIEDDFKIYLWHPNKTKVFIDNLNVSFLIPDNK